MCTAKKTGKNAGILLKKQAKNSTLRTFRGVFIFQKPYEPKRNQQFILLARFLLLLY